MVNYNTNYIGDGAAISTYPGAANIVLTITGGRFIGNSAINGGAVAISTAGNILSISGILTATRPADPRKEGVVFDGWYTEAAGGTRWNFSDDVTAGIGAPPNQYGLHLYARYRPYNTHERCLKRWTKGKWQP